MRQERSGRRIFGEFFAWWWEECALIELSRKTLEPYRYLWHAHSIHSAIMVIADC